MGGCCFWCVRVCAGMRVLYFLIPNVCQRGGGSGGFGGGGGARGHGPGPRAFHAQKGPRTPPPPPNAFVRMSKSIR